MAEDFEVEHLDTPVPDLDEESPESEVEEFTRQNQTVDDNSHDAQKKSENEEVLVNVTESASEEDKTLRVPQNSSESNEVVQLEIPMELTETELEFPIKLTPKTEKPVEVTEEPKVELPIKLTPKSEEQDVLEDEEETLI